MPTESDFLSAARLFDDAGDAVSDVPARVAGAFGPDVVTGGQLTLELTALVGQTTAACAADADSLKELADECRRRAEVVAMYEAAINSYGRQMLNHSYTYNRWLGDVQSHEANPLNVTHPGRQPRAPQRPVKPARWVDL